MTNDTDGVDVGARGWPADKGAEPVPLPKLPPAIVMHPKLGELFDRLQMQTYAMGYAVACANAGVQASQPLPADGDPEKRPDFYTWTWDVEIGGGRWEARYGWKKPGGKVHNLKPLFTHGEEKRNG